MDVNLDRADTLRKVLLTHGNLGLGQLQLLLAVAAHPRRSINELAELNNIPQQTASRYVASLSGRYQYEDNDAVELIVQSLGSDDTRKRSIELTSDGRELVSQILSELYQNIEG